MNTFKAFPKQISAAVAALLMCGAGGAFAVASLGPDAADLPVHQVLEAVTPLAVDAQTSALDAHNFTLFRSDAARAGDTAESLLARLGVADARAAAFVRGNAEARAALFGTVGRTVTAEVTQDNRLSRLSARWVPDANGGFKRVVVQNTSAGLVLRTEADALSAGTRMASGVVRTSLLAATDGAGVPETVSGQLSEIFAADPDYRQLRRGSRFSMVYETFEAEGQVMRTGRILAVEFDTSGKKQQAIWFQEPGKAGGYYRPNGQSLRKPFLEAPLEYARITSGFAMRLHPILNSWRQHNGIDYAAPTGTGVRVVGDGVVDFAGQQNGYGNVIIVKHSKNLDTVYAHLSRIDVKVGQNVAQSEFIGAVGSTGWSTGPHLHFEYRVDGEYTDPSVVAGLNIGSGTLASASRPAFDKLVAASRTDLAAASTTVQASAD